MTKTELRALALARRDALQAAVGDAGDRLRNVLIDWLRGLDLAGRNVAGYWPIGSEIDLRPTLFWLAGTGAGICLPETPPRGQALIFRAWQPGDPLVTGRFGTRHPQGRVMTPDIVLAPLLAFDRDGNRLGYGAGYYDRTLDQLPSALAVGCAFSGQEMTRIPAEPHDVGLRSIATETGVLMIRPGPR